MVKETYMVKSGCGEVILDCLGGPNVITKCPIRGRQLRPEAVKGAAEMESEVGMMCFHNGRRIL
jgi:hypothetical protein